MSPSSNQTPGNFGQMLSSSSEEKYLIKKSMKSVYNGADKHSYLKEYLNNHRKGISKTSKTTKSFNRDSQTLLDLSNGDCLKIHVDGIPSTGAKSRVETQMKLSIHLSDANGSKVPNWSYLRIDHSQLARSKLRKGQNHKFLDESLVTMSSDESRVLSLEAQIVCESNGNKIIKMCQGCVRRERKRSERKKKKSKQEINTHAESDSTVSDEAFERDRLRVLLFNCDSLVNISSGEAVIPTRITCYCRHHNERIGFRIRFAMRNSNGVIVARGQSPVIMITDDHKSSKQRSLDRKKRVAKYKTPSKDEKTAGHCTSQTDSYYSDFTPSGTPFSSHCEDSLGYFSHSRAQSPISNSSSAFHHYTSPILTPRDDVIYMGTPNIYTPTYSVQEMANQYQGTQYATTNILPTTQQHSVATDLSYSTVHTDIENMSFCSYTNSSCTNTSNLSLTHESVDQSLIQPISAINPLYNPKIQAVSPSHGPIYGGTEINVTGSGFHADLKVMFGGRSATTVCWSPISIVCILPPTENPGPVKVLFKGQQLIENENYIFNYYNNSRQEILDLSLQAVGNINGDSMQENISFVSNISSNLIRNDNLIQQQGIQSNIHFQDQEFEQEIVNILSQVYDALNLEQTNISGQNILHLAGYCDYSSIVAFIIDRHPDLVDTQDINGFSPLHFACQSKATNTIQILLNSGANVSLESNFGSPTDLVYEQNPLYNKDQFGSATFERVQEMFMSTPWVPNTFVTAATQCYQPKDAIILEPSNECFENPLMIHYLDNLLYTL